MSLEFPKVGDKVIFKVDDWADPNNVTKKNTTGEVVSVDENAIDLMLDIDASDDKSWCFYRGCDPGWKDRNNNELTFLEAFHYHCEVIDASHYHDDVASLLACVTDCIQSGALYADELIAPMSDDQETTLGQVVDRLTKIVKIMNLTK